MNPRTPHGVAATFARARRGKFRRASNGGHPRSEESGKASWRRWCFGYPPEGFIDVSVDYQGRMGSVQGSENTDMQRLWGGKEPAVLVTTRRLWC